MGYRESGNSLKGSFICHQEVVEVKQQNPWRHSIWGKQYASAGCQFPDTQHKILAETPETESRSAAFWAVQMFSESG